MTADRTSGQKSGPPELGTEPDLLVEPPGAPDLTPEELLELTRDRLRTRTRDLMKSESTLREQTRILRAVMDTMTDGVVVVAETGRFLLYNPAATNAVGVESLPMLLANPAAARPDRRDGHGVWLHEGSPCPDARLPLVRALRGETASEEELLVRCARAPAGIWLRVTAGPLRDDRGLAIGALAILRDVTKSREVEAELTRRRDELERSNTDLERFAHAVSHDLKEPMRVVAGFAQLLQRRYQGKLDPDADEFIGSIVDGVSRAWVLIDHLLEYSRVGTRGGTFYPTDPGKALDMALANLQVAVAESSARVTRGPLPIVTADPGQLARLLQNLLCNAIKFRRGAAPEIHVEARVEGDETIFTVRDNGIGIDPRHHKRIFVMFQRLHARGKYPGTGVGLAICKRIVDRHGGRIWVESEPDRGATFCFALPAEPHLAGSART